MRPVMMLDERKWAGFLIFLGAAQFTAGLVIAEALHPGYSVSNNFVSDLGVGPAAAVFNGSVFLLGLLVVVAAFLGRRMFERVFLVLLVITGIGAMGVGVFTEDAGVLHTIVSLVAFLFAGLSAIWSFRLQKPPMSYLSAVLGILGLAALVLFGSGTYAGLGRGGMERMIVYPVLAWAMAFGASLMSAEATASH